MLACRAVNRTHRPLYIVVLKFSMIRSGVLIRECALDSAAEAHTLTVQANIQAHTIGEKQHTL